MLLKIDGRICARLFFRKLTPIIKELRYYFPVLALVFNDDALYDNIRVDKKELQLIKCTRKALLSPRAKSSASNESYCDGCVNPGRPVVLCANKLDRKEGESVSSPLFDKIRSIISFLLRSST